MFVSEPAAKLDIPIFVIAIAPGEVKAWRSETRNHEEVGRNLAGAHCLAERREINLAIRRRIEGMNQHDRRGRMKIDRRQQCRCGSMQQLVADGIVKMFNLQQSMQEIEAYLLVFRCGDALFTDQWPEILENLRLDRKHAKPQFIPAKRQNVSIGGGLTTRQFDLPFRHGSEEGKP